MGKPSWRIEFAQVKQCHQRQDDVYSQLRDLVDVANRFGFYDAADHLKQSFENVAKKREKKIKVK